MDSRIQTDNGKEFVANWQRKSESAFTLCVESFKGLRHTTIPPRAHTWQSDVETAHRLIEDDFYEVERFASRSDFLRKAGAYDVWFDVARRNSGKEHKTPWKIIHSGSRRGTRPSARCRPSSSTNCSCESSIQN
jgi:hypothetical protein